MDEQEDIATAERAVDEVESLCYTDQSITLFSQGLWDPTRSKGFLNYALPRLHLQIALMFLLSQSLSLMLRRYHLPRIVPELLAGLILGHTVMGGIFPEFTTTLFPAEGDFIIQILWKIGFMFFMFLSGVKMNPSLILKSGRKAWTIALVSLLIVVNIGVLANHLINQLVVPVGKRVTVTNIIGTYMLTPFPVIACLLMDLNIITTELGRLTMATTLIREMLNTFVVAALNFLRIGIQTHSAFVAIKAVILCVGLVVVIVVSGRPFFMWIIKQTPEGKPVKGVYVSLIAGGVLLSAIASENAGIRYPFGPFILGLTVPDGPPLGSTLVEKLETYTSGLLTPLMVTYCGLKANLRRVYNVKVLMSLFTLVGLSTLVKFGSILLPSFLCKLPPRDAFALSLVMSTQGVVELSNHLANREIEAYDAEIFSWLIVSVLITATVVPLVVRSIYDTSRTYVGYQKRNILHSFPDEELRILVCAHRQDDALAVIKFLEPSTPTRETPTSIYALVLVELLGQAAPLLINHRFGQKASTTNRSQQIIDSFHYFEQEYYGFVDVQTFTAISIPKFMHHDICSLAFDHLASLIILPFHRKWNSQGKMFMNNDMVRTINQNVLESAPCSVAILIDRRKIQPPVEPSNSVSFDSPLKAYRVAVIFVGGEDDREALAYGKRQAMSSDVHLTVVRITADDECRDENWDVVYDTETLKEIRQECAHRGNVVFREERVSDGPETASVIHALEDEYDLLIVGRRHRLDSPIMAGLKEWTELPELGVLGDILASPDLNKPVSVLVIQQQQMKIK